MSAAVALPVTQTMTSGVEAYKTFERGTPAGDVLYRLYGGKKAMPSTLDPAMLKRAKANRELQAHAPPKPRPVPKSRAHVNIPRAAYSAPDRSDWCPPQRPQLQYFQRKPKHAIMAEQRQVAAEVAARPAPDRLHITEEDKDRLVQHMQFNGEKPPSPQQLPPVRQPRTPSPPTSELQMLREMFRNIEDEVQERRDFLDDMRRMGQGKKYEAQIRAEVGERVNEMKRLDRLIRDEERRGS